MNIKKLRTEAGLSQTDLARMVDVDQATVSYWESGKNKPLRKTWKPLAKALKVSVEELLQSGDPQSD